MLNEDWLPHIQVVRLPQTLRQLDPRALPSGTWTPTTTRPPRSPRCCRRASCSRATTTTSPRWACAPPRRASTAVMALIAINIGEMQVHTVLVVPALPSGSPARRQMGLGPDRPGAWVILAPARDGGIYWYRKQPPERRGADQGGRGHLGTTTWEYAAASQGSLTGPAATCAPASCPGPGSAARPRDPAGAGGRAGVAVRAAARRPARPARAARG